jgi:hypothetical protein
MPSSMSRLFVVSMLTASAGACLGGDDDTNDPNHYNCEAEDRDEEFVAGMQKPGTSGFTFALMTSTPAPPGRGDNTWLIDVANNGAPFEGTVEVTPFMPDHRHGTPIEAIVTPVEGTPGRYSVAPVNLWMPGLWEITIEAQPTETTRDSAVFRFCITG